MKTLKPNSRSIEMPVPLLIIINNFYPFIVGLYCASQWQKSYLIQYNTMPTILQPVQKIHMNM